MTEEPVPETSHERTHKCPHCGWWDFEKPVTCPGCGGWMNREAIGL